MDRRRHCLAVFFLLLLGPITSPALEWRQTSLEARAAPFQKTVTLVFAYKNTGTRPVHLLDIQTSCSCLEAKRDKSVCAPGESGQIQAQFSAEEPPGLYERHITLLTDESDTPQRLTVRIDIPELALLTPRSIEWKLHEAAEEKSIELRAAGELRIDFTQATPSNDSFLARLEPIEPGRIFKLTLRPLSTAAFANAAIRISGRDADGHAILISAYANVR